MNRNRGSEHVDQRGILRGIVTSFFNALPAKTGGAEDQSAEDPDCRGLAAGRDQGLGR